MYHKNILRRIKEQFDWESYIEENYTAKRAHGKNGPELRICCPSCHENGYKCYINPEKKAFNCYKCGFSTRSSDLFQFVALTESISRGAAIIRLVIEFKPTAPDDSFDIKSYVEDQKEEEISHATASEAISLPKQCVPLTSNDTTGFWQYAKKRGFTEADLKATNLHITYAGNLPVYAKDGVYKGNLANRLIFPIYKNGHIVSWLARDITDKSSQKYLNCPDTKIGSTLWPFSPPYSDTVVLVEGVIDALAVRRVSGVSAYATFGKKISPEQANILRAWGVKNIIIWYDKKDAISDMVTAVDFLKMRFSQVFVLELDDWPDDKDVGDYLLSDTNGAAIIEAALSKRINVYDSLEYARWTKINS